MNNDIDINAIFDSCKAIQAQCEKLYDDLIANQKQYDAAKKEAENAEMLQKDANLAADIESMKNLIDKTNAEADKVYTDYCSLSNKLDDYRVELRRLEVERENLHKTWIAANPAVKKPEVNRPDIRDAFECLWTRYYDMKCDYDKLYKRFDNLIHARCKSTEMFGYDWRIEDVINYLQGYLSNDKIQWLKEFHDQCEKH